MSWRGMGRGIWQDVVSGGCDQARLLWIRKSGELHGGLSNPSEMRGPFDVQGPRAKSKGWNDPPAPHQMWVQPLRFSRTIGNGTDAPAPVKANVGRDVPI